MILLGEEDNDKEEQAVNARVQDRGGPLAEEKWRDADRDRGNITGLERPSEWATIAGEPRTGLGWRQACCPSVECVL
jgi:hypothetical protein